MTFPEDASYVFLVITWGEEQHESFGPYLVQADGSHLEQIAEKGRTWRAEHPDRPGMAAHLFATRLLPPDEKPKSKVQLNITSPPPTSVVHVPVLPEEWLRA